MIKERERKREGGHIQRELIKQIRVKHKIIAEGYGETLCSILANFLYLKEYQKLWNKKKSYILLEIRVISEESKIKLKLAHTRFHWLLLGAFTLWKSANFIHKSRFDLFFCWLARLKKMIEEMLIMQIKVYLKVCQVRILYILNSTKTIKEIFFQYSKASMRFNKKKLLNTLTSQWISDRCLYYFTFILVININ